MNASQAPPLTGTAAKQRRELIDDLSLLARNWLEFDPAGKGVEELFDPAYIRVGTLLLEAAEVSDGGRVGAMKIETNDIRTQLIEVRRRQLDFGAPVPPPDFPRKLEPILRPRWERELPPTTPIEWSVPEGSNLWYWRLDRPVNENWYPGNRYGLHADLGWGYWTPDNRQFVAGQLPLAEREFLREFGVRYAKEGDLSSSIKAVYPSPKTGHTFDERGQRWIEVIKNRQRTVVVLLDPERRDQRLARSAKYTEG